MSYVRVLPRDLFNEGNLLKCYGQVALLLHDGAYKNVTFPGDHVYAFEIDQRNSDGFTFIRNLPLNVNDEPFRLVRPLNALTSWPLYCESINDPDLEQINVFNKNGQFSSGMVELLRSANG